MKEATRAAFAAELQRADDAESQGDLATAFAHLERAHILGQRYFITHLRTHFRMLRIARRRKDGKETRGQILRIMAVVPGYIFGWVPKGNTGGANVSAIRPMHPPEDLASHVRDYHVWRDVVVRLIVWSIALFLISAAFGFFESSLASR